MPIFGIAGGIAGSALGTTGVVAGSVVGGAVLALAVVTGGTQIAANVTQPDATSVNLSNVSTPNYAD